MHASNEPTAVVIEAEFDAEQLGAIPSGSSPKERLSAQALTNRQSIDDVQQLRWPAIEIEFDLLSLHRLSSHPPSSLGIEAEEDQS
jgi:hypothetical protein